MENFDQQYGCSDPSVQEAQTPCPESPFADSPYTAQQPNPDYMPPVIPRKKKSNAWKYLLAAAVVVTLVLSCCAITALCMNFYWNEKLDHAQAELEQTIEQMQSQFGGTVSRPSAEIDADGLLTPAEVYSQNVNTVVAISNQGLTTNIFGQVSRTASSGSGFIISADGYIVSNYHVVSGASKLSVILADGTEYDAAIVGYDQSNDIAVLKIDAKNLPCVTIGSSESLVEGDRVAAIGNPLGELTSSLTVGYVSAKDRTVNTDGTYINMLQTDAAINPGNSGGPLFNMYGEVIGITTAKYGGMSSNGATIEGIGFAIPIDDVRNMIDDLRQHGQIRSGYLGIVAQDVVAEDAQQYGLPMGALVVEVTADSCAERAGIQAKDIITALEDHTVESLSDLTRALGNYEGGEKLTVTVYRSGTRHELDVTLDSKPVDAD